MSDIHATSRLALRGLFLSAATACAMSVSPAQAQTGAPDARDVVRTQSGQIVVNSFGNCVRTKWNVGSDACNAAVPPTPAPVRATIGKEERTVYFDFNKTALRPESRQRLDSLANTLKSDSQVQGARIVGYADRIGNTTYNERLSQRRAETVRSYLVQQGLVNTRVADTRWFGEENPATNCSDSLPRAELIECLQKDRRVEVEIDYLPEGQVRR